MRSKLLLTRRHTNANPGVPGDSWTVQTITPGQPHLCDAPDRKAQAHGRRCGVAPGYTEGTRDHLHAAGGCPWGLCVNTKGLLKERKAGATCQLLMTLPAPGSRVRGSGPASPGQAPRRAESTACHQSGVSPLPAAPRPRPRAQGCSPRRTAPPHPRGPHPDGQRAVLAAYGAAAVRAAGLRRATVLLLLLEDLRVEFL